MKEKKDDNLEFTLYDTLNISEYLNVKKKDHSQTKKDEPPKKCSDQQKDTSLYNDLKSDLMKNHSSEKKVVVSKKIEKKKLVDEEILDDTVVLCPVKTESKQKSKEVKDKVSTVLPVETFEEDLLLDEPELLEDEKEPVNVEKIFEEIDQEEVSESKVDVLETKKKEHKKKVQKEKNEISKEECFSKKWKASLITFIVLDIFACIGLFLTYGPISYFRNLLITSAMTTMNHHYLAKTFYSDKMIEKVLKSNHVKESSEETNSSEIDFEDGKDTGEYDSIYEEQILKREEGNDLYKVISIKDNGYKGYLVAIYDASRVHLVSANNLGYGGAFLTDISKKNKAKVAINASGFFDGTASGKGSVAVGTVIQNGKIVSQSGTSGMGGGLAGFNEDNILVLTKKSAKEAIAEGMVDAVEFGPFLIVNGKSSEVAGNGGWGLAPRTVLAQRKDGIVLFLVVDGRGSGGSVGAGMDDLIEILERYEAYNAVNLDGGGSSTLTVENKITNHPSGGERYIPNAWIVK